MNVRPLYDRILVERVEEETKSKGGLFLPESAKEKPSEGRVLAVGQGRVSDGGDVKPLVVKVGDLVFFKQKTAYEIKIDGQDRLILREDEIFGIVSA